MVYLTMLNELGCGSSGRGAGFSGKAIYKGELNYIPEYVFVIYKILINTNL
jgi:hypothetical protein